MGSKRFDTERSEVENLVQMYSYIYMKSPHNMFVVDRS